MSKQAMREETERLIKEAMERKNIAVKTGDTRIETKCGKCGAPSRISAPPGQTRVEFTCKQCGHVNPAPSKYENPSSHEPTTARPAASASIAVTQLSVRSHPS